MLLVLEAFSNLHEELYDSVLEGRFFVGFFLASFYLYTCSCLNNFFFLHKALHYNVLNSLSIYANCAYLNIN